jgi:hypothetical protein
MASWTVKLLHLAMFAAFSGGLGRYLPPLRGDIWQLSNRRLRLVLTADRGIIKLGRSHASLCVRVLPSRDDTGRGLGGPGRRRRILAGQR